MTTTCPDCHEPFRIAPSKRLQICPNCLSVRRTGKSLKEIASQKHRESMEKSRLKSKAKSDLKPKTVYVIKNRSTKGAKQEREVSKTKTELKRKATDTGFAQCEGCGVFFKSLDASHIVPLSQSSALASIPGNIRLLCRCCHNAWEGNGTVAELIALKCFLPDMRYLFENDKSRFYNILDRLLREYNARPTPKLGMVLGKIEKFETQTEQ